MALPQVLITLNPEGGLTLELPGANGARRKIPFKRSDAKVKLLLSTLGAALERTSDPELRLLLQQAQSQAGIDYDDTMTATLTRILTAQAAKQVALGEDGAPTEAQVRHWQRHTIYPVDGCAFCLKEGRVSFLPRETEAQGLIAKIKHLDKSGADDWRYRELLSVRQSPLAKKHGSQRAETWRDRAVALRERLLNAERGIIILAQHGAGANAVTVRKVPKGHVRSGTKAKQAKVSIPVDLEALGAL